MSAHPQTPSASRLSGEWSDDDYDVLADGVVVGRIMKAMAAPEGDARLWNAGPRPPRGPHVSSRGTWSQFNPPDVHSAVRVAPNGDIFIAESEPGRIRVLRAADGTAKPSSNEVFASGLDHPFGIAFYPPGSDPQWIYVAHRCEPPLSTGVVPTLASCRYLVSRRRFPRTRFL
jgi:glucose/arabinose dehydrogenase